MGSPDLYSDQPREPEQSINFVTSHDGFTLADLVAYDHKHNEANLEHNRDGTDHNLSWNCGVEGPTGRSGRAVVAEPADPNLLAINLLSLGAPMILMGDEVCRTQHGNNNAYCQDNETTWFDWTDLERHADIHRFVRELIKLRFIRESVRSSSTTSPSTELMRPGPGPPPRCDRSDAPDLGHVIPQPRVTAPACPATS